MTDEQMKELAELRVAIQDLKYQLIQKHDLRELTDEEILRIADSVVINDRTLGNFSIDFARAILKKASEKYCNKCNNKGWVCEWHPDKEAHKCCGGAGMPCECTKESR
jgi:hypothetical protein